MDHVVREQNYNAGFGEGSKVALDFIKVVKENLTPLATDEDFRNGIVDAICWYVNYNNIKEILGD